MMEGERRMVSDPDRNQRAARFERNGITGKQKVVVTEPYWQSFPRMEKLLGAERPVVLAQIEATCRQLDTILKSGSPQECARAQAAMNAYARTLELYRQLTRMRDKAWAASNLASTANDK
jgi:hypothetical protein